MRAFLIAAVVVCYAMPGSADDSAEIEALIRDQFAAFAERDAEEAWSYASPMIQGMFQTPENFAKMVEGGYPMIWSAEDVDVLGLREEAGRLLQRLSVKGPDGGRFYFDYEMIRLDGQWRINGVWPVKGDDLSA
ncbi:MAG TPA: DUF4864 domain-containing protein [Paracoccaceae bacterium]|nr:DUF4864 domain-containing protein [Paracoccaceae bacterium]